MHFRITFPSLRMFRFRQWSRKAYSVFCSLHRQVTIGQVGKSIADASLTKEGGNATGKKRKACCLTDDTGHDSRCRDYLSCMEFPAESQVCLTDVALLVVMRGMDINIYGITPDNLRICKAVSRCGLLLYRGMLHGDTVFFRCRLWA